MFGRGVSFKTVVGTGVTAVGVLALLAAGALAYLTSELRRTTEELRDVVEGVRLAEEAATDLLLHARIEDPLARREVERDLREKLERAHGVAESDAERAILRTAVDRVGAYLAGGPSADPGALDAAFDALDALVAANVQRSRAADARARALDRLGDALGLGTAALLVVAAGWLLWWLRSRAFQPLFALAEAMRRFGAGDASARAPDTGPAELRAMARRFNEMASALAELRERQMTLLAGLAHDLRNPLSALKLATARTAAEGEGGAADPKLLLVRRQVLRLERLVTDVLETARIEAGRLDVRPEPVDLRKIVESAVSLFEASSAAHRITVRSPDEAVIASCDPGRVEQVLNNLLSNAIKYSPDGGRIDVRVEARTGAVAVSVADEGIGVQDDPEALFQPFRRGRTSQGDIPGVGLGLYVSRQIVEAHGGHIHVTRRPGRGAIFEVVLPR